MGLRHRLDADPKRTGKLLGDKLELLRWRVAAKLGYKSVGAWEQDTTTHERAHMVALAMIDAWGEEWAENAAGMANQTRAALVIAGANSADIDITTVDKVARKFVGVNDDEPQQEFDWQAAQGMLKTGLTGLK